VDGLTPMRALTIDRQDGPEALVVAGDAPDPVAGTGDVLLRVGAAGYTPTELTWPSTWVDRSGHDRTPVVPCHEVSGTVEALGWGATGFAVGDEVWGLGDWYRDGGAAELMAVEARNLAPKPRTLDHVEAAALPLAGLTAAKALFDHGRLEAGQTVLVLGAAGGVGALGVQMARAAGARVLAVAHARHHGLLRDLGVDGVYEDPADAADQAVDLVFDTVGGELLARALLRAPAVLISVAEPPPPGARGLYFVVEPHRAGLAEMARAVDAGELRPLIGFAAPLDDAAAAVVRKERHEIGGKLVIDVAG
jgi:NADPH:quinone reductase-like Zn-dependent oxidoreductase